MKDLTIIDGQNEKFVLIDTETNKQGLTAFYVIMSKYNDGFFNDEDIIPIQIDYVSQGAERIVGGWETPDILDVILSPEDEYFDCAEAKNAALEVANQMILQHEIVAAHV